MNQSRKFLFKLCSHLGYKSVAEMENSLSINEFLEWQDYYREEQFLADRLELMIATLTAITYSANGGKDLTAVDFMLSVSIEEKEKAKQKERNAKVFSALESFGN